MESKVITAHRFSMNNRPLLLNDKKCGCFYCLSIFNPSEINEWIDDSVGTAVCPYCGTDSVIGENSGYQITKDFLSDMHQYWF